MLSDAFDRHAVLLQALSATYLRHGQAQRAVGLCLVGLKLHPDNGPLLRTLAKAFLDAEMPSEAIETLDRLDELGLDRGDESVATLLRSRALWRLERKDEARQTMRRYVAACERRAA